MTDSTQDPVAATEASSASLQDTQADGLQATVSTDAGTAALPEASAPAAPTSTVADTAAPPSNPAAHLFPALDAQAPTVAADIDMVMDIPVQLSVELGRTRLTIKNILQLGQGSVVELDGMAGEPMDICINGYLIAQGEVVVVDDKYGIRVTDIITPADRLQRINQRC